MSARKIFYQAGQRIATTISGGSAPATPRPGPARRGSDASVIFLDGILCTALRSGSERPVASF